ncbi:20-hydroxyecdysone protein [Drosophila sechellia]|uniref:GM14048 n=1 Tax=Drosophila sechellia TaxID=7238 RepID=B4HTS7_DROSE|nr:20-hydroxyecdysone protein [Drosophila sechellia]EDW50348.1 GM14048 [Drosophila sechellia]
MKPVALILVFLAISQARVLNLPKEAIDIPVAIVEDKEPPVALSLVKEEVKEEAKPEEVKPIAQEEKAKDLKEIVKPEIKEEPKEDLKPDIKEDPNKKIEEQITELLSVKPQQLREKSLETEEKPQEIKEEVQQPEIKKEATEIKEEPAQNILKALPAEETVVVPAEELSPNPVEQEQSENQDAAHPQVRQATQATPTQQSTTQGNFVQQLIQNSPIGQFLNQFQPQPAAAAAPAPAQVQADDAAAAAPATPAPTVPGFLNPQAAITSAQQAVQNAAQSAVNATTQAFQGIQQFASNLGNQFQNTLSSLTGQQQQAVSTTPRPPGPIQQFVNNVFGGNNNATAAAPPAQQSGNPLQGIINFLGGNRPQNAPAAAPATQAPEKPAVDDKIDPAKDEVAEYVPESDNELRASGENIDDSFEDAGVPSNEVIVVNDDAGEEGNAVQNHPVATDAVAL